MASAMFLSELYQQNRAIKTFNALDATWFHSQIFFVDTNNSIGRIAGTLLECIATCNNAMFVLLLFLATLNGYGNARPSDETNKMCSKLSMCLVHSTDLETSFSINDSDEYYLVIVIDNDIQSFILGLIDDDKNQRYYSSKVQLLLDLLNTHKNDILSPIMLEENHDNNKLILENMLECDLLEGIKPS